MTPSPLQQLAAQELLRRQEAVQSMWEYQKYLAASHADFLHAPAAHHDCMIQALHALERDECKGVLIMAPPGSAKSSYVSVQFATWYLARHPTHHILACSNTTDLAEVFNRRRRNVCYTEEWQRLGDGYRVEAAFILWEGSDILQIPASALFRHAGEWTVFAIADGRAERRKVTLGRRNGLQAQILSGLTKGEQVILHPDESIEQGTRVQRRE